MLKHPLVIRIPRGAPGDTVAASALVRDLTIYRPNYQLFVSGAYAEDLFRYDPRVGVGIPNEAITIHVTYREAMDASADDSSRRYMAAAHQCYQQQTGDPLPLDEPRPSLCLGPSEYARPDPLPYALVASGVKGDIPLKQAPPSLFEAVIAGTPDLRWKQIGKTEAARISHTQRPIPGTENLLGTTDLRQLMRLVAHASVVLCHTSLPMLLAAAFKVPCVVIGGGREDPWFHACDGVTYLHTIGRLACCASAGCRAAFPRPAHDGKYQLGTVCADPVNTGNVWIGRCMSLFSPSEVITAIRDAMAAKCVD